MKQILILASGEQNRWELTGKPGSRKQLLKVGNEKIIERIIRQCKERDTDPIVVTHHEDIMHACQGVTCLPVLRKRWTVETLSSTMAHWRDRTVVLLGDTVYSKSVMDRIFDCSDPMRVFGNELEIFALSFTRDTWSSVTWALMLAIEHAKSGGPDKLRKFYQAYCGLDLDSDQMEDKIIDWVCHVTDYTKDIDTPEDYRAFLYKVVKAGSLDDNPL